MSTITKRYRIDGVDDYTIEYRLQSNGTYAIVATSCPPDPYDGGPSVHHRYSGGAICVATGREPRTLDRAVAITSLWMKRYSQYIRTGTFDNSGTRVNV
jgi:hypothetical protein